MHPKKSSWERASEVDYVMAGTFKLKEAKIREMNKVKHPIKLYLLIWLQSFPLTTICPSLNIVCNVNPTHTCFHLHIDGFTTDLIKKGRHFGHKDPPEDPKSAFSTFSRTALEATVSTFYQ